MNFKKRIPIILIILFLLIFSFFCFWRYQDRDYNIILQQPSKTEKATPENIHVGTYNIKSLDSGTALNDFTKDIQALDLDIIALQEVDQNASRSRNLEMIKDMAEANDYPYYYFFKSMWILDGDYGLGILSKYPILEIASKELPNGTLSEPRILASATIDVNGTSIKVYNTHLNYFNRELRQKQIDFISNEIKNQKNVLFMGDMNSFRDEDFYSIDGFQALNTIETPYVTFREFGSPDNIFHSNNLNIQKVDLKRTSFSDHHLLWCIIKL